MTNFHILIKDNFFEKDLLNKLQINVMQLKFDAQSSGFFRKGKGLKNTNYDNKNHTWFSVPVEKDVEKIIEDKCIKLFNKKLKLNFCFYTILGKAHPMPHCDLKKNAKELDQLSFDRLDSIVISAIKNPPHQTYIP